MWTAADKTPLMLERFGLGREPVWSDADQCWYARSGGQLMKHPGMGTVRAAPNEGRIDTEAERLLRLRGILPNRGLHGPLKACGCKARHPGMGRAGLGDVSDGGIQTTAAALLAYLQANGAGTGTNGGSVSDFLSAYNAASGNATIPVDDEYGPCTEQALQLALNAAPAAGGGGPTQAAPATAFSGKCSNGQYVAPAGGGGGGGGPIQQNQTGATSTGIMGFVQQHQTQLLIGAGVLAAGVVGYAAWKHRHKIRRVYRVVGSSRRR